MIKIQYFLAIFTAIFFNVTANAATPVCQKHIIKNKQISIKCAFPESKEHISTLISGSFEFYEYANTETEKDIDWIHLNKLVILKNGRKSQEINLESVENGIRLSGVAGAVQLMDLNFDGYDDIQLWVSPTAGANSSYEYWLYNPDTQQFEYNNLKDKLFGFDVTPDPKSKTIFIQSHSGCCYNWERTYHWIGNELRKKTELYYGSIAIPGNTPLEEFYACGQTIDHYNDNEEIVSMDIEPSSYCKGDEHNAPQTLEPFLTKLKNEEKNGEYVLRKNGEDKYTVIYNKPAKEKI